MGATLIAFASLLPSRRYEDVYRFRKTRAGGGGGGRRGRERGVEGAGERERERERTVCGIVVFKCVCSIARTGC